MDDYLPGSSCPICRRHQGRSASGWYIEFGPQYGFLLSSTYNYNNTRTVNTRTMYKNYNFSVGGGFGYEFQKQSVKDLGITFVSCKASQPSVRQDQETLKPTCSAWDLVKSSSLKCIVRSARSIDMPVQAARLDRWG